MVDIETDLAEETKLVEGVQKKLEADGDEWRSVV